MAERRTSRIPGFYELDLEGRHEALHAALLSEPARAWLAGGGGLPVTIADRMSENVIGAQGLPMAVALNLRVNHRDYVVPMAIEEPSVVAAASAAAKLVRIGGGFIGDADAPVMTAQVQLDQVAEPERAAARLETARAQLMRLADASIPRMVARGGGCRDLDVRVLDAATGMVVVQLYIDVGNAMGANLVDTVAEAVAPAIEALLGGRVGLRILSNLPLRRKARVTARIGVDAVGAELAAGIASASRFAELDPMRAVTHNKGIMNGIDAVALALGQDWRAIEAGAHAYAALGGRYAPLATWRVEEDALIGRLELPLAVGTVGGATRVHPGVRAAFELLDVADARDLAVVMAAAGLASNLAALKALAGEGIQRGHMRLHRRRLDEGAPETDNETDNETNTEAVTPGRSS